VSWVKATDEQLRGYRDILSLKVSDIDVPTEVLLCRDIHCSNLTHLHYVNKYATDITEACLSAAESIIPRTCGRHDSNRIAGWTEHVQPMRDKSMFWHNLWLECGRPRTGVVADCMRRTSAAYHYAIRAVKRDQDKIINERIAVSILQNSSRDFWAEIKRIRSNKSGASRIVDGQANCVNIAKLFATKYRDLYTSVPYDINEMRCICNEIETQLSDSETSALEECLFTTHDLKYAVSRLAAHKNDGGTGLTSDHIINAGLDCLTHIALLFTAIAIHGTVPDTFLYSTIVPIPKGRNANASDSSNFRGITLSSIFGKMFDNIVLNRYRDRLLSSELQFGFKTSSSTNLCTMVLKESLAYYARHNSSVFCTFLDASKAFDRLRYCKLFKMLITRQLPAAIVRILINFYTSNFVRVQWCGVVSDYFLAINGVKQGGVSSPVLFCVYIDGLLTALLSAGVGCYIGDNYVGALAYADDIVLLAPSASALRTMLAVCDNYANEYSIQFNATKTKCLVVLPSSRRSLSAYLKDYPFYIGNKPIEYVDSFEHLGHLITNQLTDNADIAKRQSDFVRQVNNVLCFFTRQKSCVKYKLFQSYCMNLCGRELWSLSNDHLSDLSVSWRKSLRRIRRLPHNTHSYLLSILSQCLPLFDEICRRSLKFIDACLSSESNLVRAVAKYGVQYGMQNSFLGHNAAFCARRYNCKFFDASGSYVDIQRVVKSYVDNLTDDLQICTAGFVFELILLREKDLVLSNSLELGLSHDELDLLVNVVCTC
jgi:hypothetical protein